MSLHLLRMRRNVDRNVFNDRKNISATTCVYEGGVTCWRTTCCHSGNIYFYWVPQWLLPSDNASILLQCCYVTDMNIHCIRWVKTIILLSLFYVGIAKRIVSTVFIAYYINI